MDKKTTIKEQEHKKITLILDEVLEVQLQQQAERMGITRTELINIILYDYFQNIVQEWIQFHDQWHVYSF